MVSPQTLKPLKCSCSFTFKYTCAHVLGHQRLIIMPLCVCLRSQAIYASVLPGELMRGYMSQFPTFPSWLGKNSSTSKHSRIVQELASHMSLK